MPGDVERVLAIRALLCLELCYLDLLRLHRLPHSSPEPGSLLVPLTLIYKDQRRQLLGVGSFEL